LQHFPQQPLTLTPPEHVNPTSTSTPTSPRTSTRERRAPNRLQDSITPEEMAGLVSTIDPFSAPNILLTRNGIP
ncbi:hypothetical protein FRC02_002370, partial [Tulasnella sp. 418]